MKPDVYNILFTPSSAYFKQTLTTMLSAILNCKKSCHFFVMESDWTEKQKADAYEFIQLYPENKIDIIDVDNEQFHIFRPFKRIYYTSYYKILAHVYLPEDVEEALYLDPDVIVRKDIDGLYSMEFEDNYYIAVNSYAETHSTEKNSDWIGIDKSKRHLVQYSVSNPGVLYINLKRFRDENIGTDFYVNALNEISDENYWYEEGLLNYLFWEKRKYVKAYKYQTMIRFVDVHKEIFKLSEEERKNYNEDYWEAYEEKDALTMIHFVNAITAGKPWSCVYDKGTDTVIDQRGHRANSVEEPYYKEWWHIAEQLPLAVYEDFIKESYESVFVMPLKDRLSAANKVLPFFEALGYDSVSELRYIRYINSLRGKKISILKSGDMTARFLCKSAKNNDIHIVFSSKKWLFNQLTKEEWKQCRQADVIINCCVHGAKPEERDGIKPVMIWDILKNGLLLPDNSNFELALSNNKLFNTINSVRDDLNQKFNDITNQVNGLWEKEKSNYEYENKKLREEKAGLKAEVAVLVSQTENLRKEYLTLKEEQLLLQNDYTNNKKILENEKSELCSKVISLNEDICALKNDFFVLEQDSEHKAKQLTDELNNAVLQKDHFENQAKTYADKIAVLSEQLENMQNSHSWKMTKPLRFLLSFFRTLFRKKEKTNL